jgi:hypothetical protein
MAILDWVFGEISGLAREAAARHKSKGFWLNP